MKQFFNVREEEEVDKLGLKLSQFDITEASKFHSLES